MKPALFAKKEDYPSSGYGIIADATDCKVHEVLNGDYTFTFNLPRTSRFFELIKPEYMIYVPVNGTSKDWFYIKSTDVKSSPDTMTVTCNHESILANNGYMKGSLSIDRLSVQTALKRMTDLLDSTGKQFKYQTSMVRNIGDVHVTYTNMNPTEMIIGNSNSLVNILGGRIERNGRTINIAEKYTGRSIDLRKGKNISGISIQKNIESIVTSIVPYYTEKEINTTDPDKPTTPTNPPETGWTVTSNEGVVTVTKSPGATCYSDANQPENNRLVGVGTPWYTDQKRTKSGSTQYRIGTNCWVSAGDVTFAAQSNVVSYSSDSTPTKVMRAVATTPKEEERVWGAEVYSPMYKKYKLPHRKVVDYSSRVDNDADLSELAHRYFYENPGVDEPTYTISIDTVPTQNVSIQNAHIGDTARIYDPDFKIATEQIIFEREFDSDKEINTLIKAGTYQQTIFRYLDNRIKENDQKIDDTNDQTNNAIENNSNDISNVQDNVDTLGDETNDWQKRHEEEEKRIQAEQDRIDKKVDDAQRDLSDFMNSGGQNVIQFLPDRENPTQLKVKTGYGYLLLDDHGIGFHKSNGTVITGMSSDGRFYADDISAQTITGKTIEGGVINGARITGAQITGTEQINLGSGSRKTSLAYYGISTPSITVDEIDGLNFMQASNITVTNQLRARYLIIESGGNISSPNGALYLTGPLYVNGRLIAS
ncbi:phage tail protein [Companilactobacillus metriopterae]|uniref:phage tail protein n=1 Tax=Companilactobacillus metriopterae TaxID=1909267 RepID=UPI0013E96BAE|nr:phage tail protein [Companilactobacillus metriopterae]